MNETAYLLDDAIRHFIRQGFVSVQGESSPEFHAMICRKLDEVIAL
jgi:hypothetical protein